ncbi:hypothetical protein D6S17_28165 [Salmonella enterica subsp. enterica serovar Java]|uniref:Uncharacterized protein n=1 Tax=Salmonella enterica subsp. enterica serovar Java TaxID=224729 RepID=A0A5X0ZGE3_SALEB|nr:hypothetical protein [Salmonella enterica]EBY8645326.1 hypothetical protein [Salmonella enterica subsp. enterica serovar Java]
MLPVLPDGRPDRAEPVRGGADNRCYVKQEQPGSGTGCAIVIPRTRGLTIALGQGVAPTPRSEVYFIPRKGDRGCEQRGGKSPEEASRHDPANLFIF